MLSTRTVTPVPSNVDAPPSPDVQASLGKLIREHSYLCKTLGWQRFITTLQQPRDTASYLNRLPHPAASFLHRISSVGIPAPSSSAPWTMSRKRHHYQRGAHYSASAQYRTFLWDDMLDMVRKGYWTILPFHLIKSFSHLKLSPAGVVPQRTRRPRPIMDYSFTEVNQYSIPLAPDSMQIGHTLHRLLQNIAYANPAFGPPLLCKFDLSDGYYRVRLTPEAALELAVVIPGFAPNHNLIALPLCLPMGWGQSPPYFCAFTETITDLANAALHSTRDFSEHPLELISQAHAVPVDPFEPTILRPPTAPLHQPLSLVDVYVDDFIGLAQPPLSTHTLRALLHSVDKVFRSHPVPDDKPWRKATISSSKLATGDGAWSTRKTILGWDIDTAAGTIGLPEHKADRLRHILQHFATLRRTSRKKWQSLLGELRHMAMVIPGAKYLFSILQHVLVDQPQSRRLRLSSLVQHSLRDWIHLASVLPQYPMPIASLVPRAPNYIGAVDASGTGIGGYWLPTSVGHLRHPLAFRVLFPSHIASRLVSCTNKPGTITNSDFELAALVTGTAILAPLIPSQPATLLCGSDNTAALHWCSKGSTSSQGPAAHLLRWLSMLSREFQVSLCPTFVSGKTNTLADFCSRSFHLSDQDFLQALNEKFPMTVLWTLAHPTPEVVSTMTSTLSANKLPWASPSKGPEPRPQLGITGSASVTPCTLTPPCNTQTTQYYPYKFSPLDTGEANCLPAKLRSAARRWLMPFVPSGRRWPTWDIVTPGSYLQAN